MGHDRLEAGREFVRRHHVHFDVRDEVVIAGEERRKIGYRIRVWGVLPVNGLLPGDAVEGPFAQELVALAEQLVPAAVGETSVIIDRPAPAIYDSRLVAGADEIALDIRLVHGQEGEAPSGADEERCLRSIRKALGALGAPQQD